VPVRILIVEDHPTMREAMRLVLEGEGYEVSEATDGPEALEAIRGALPDLVFLDQHLPGQSGGEVLQAIRADPRTAGVRVIVVTADGEEGRAPAMRQGADAYVVKPFGPEALLATVTRLLSSPSEGG
jgi:two-component system, cell cycle response regulator DivK